MFVRRNQSIQPVKFEDDVIVQLLNECSERLGHLILEEQNLQMKIADVAQVSAEEINDICKHYHSKLYHELTLTQRQELFAKKVKETSNYLLDKIYTIFSNYFNLIVDTVEMASICLFENLDGSHMSLKGTYITEILEKTIFNITVLYF